MIARVDSPSDGRLRTVRELKQYSAEVRRRWPLTCALVELFNYPTSVRYLRFVSNLAWSTGHNIAGSGRYEVAHRGEFVDVLEIAGEP